MTNISRHPLIKQSYDLIQAIEVCGASTALTAAVRKACDLMEAIDKHIPDQSRVDSGLNFGAAIETMKQGFRVARTGWNGKGMFLFVIQGSNDIASLHGYGFGELVGEPTFRDAIFMKTADNQLVPWTASQTDVLADDWTVLP